MLACIYGCRGRRRNAWLVVCFTLRLASRPFRSFLRRDAASFFRRTPHARAVRVLRRGVEMARRRGVPPALQPAPNSAQSSTHFTVLLFKSRSHGCKNVFVVFVNVGGVDVSTGHGNKKKARGVGRRFRSRSRSRSGDVSVSVCGWNGRGQGVLILLGGHGGRDTGRESARKGTFT